MQDTDIYQSEHMFDHMEEWLTSDQIKDEWGVWPSTLSRWHQSGKVPTRRKVNARFVYLRGEISEAYWTSSSSSPSDDDIIEEANFKRGFGKPWEVVIQELAHGMRISASHISARLHQHFPEVRVIWQ